MTNTEFAEGLWDKLEAKCSTCGSHQPLCTGHVTTHLSGPACRTCGENYEWEDGRPMLLFPSNIDRVFGRMKTVFEERLKDVVPEDPRKTGLKNGLRQLSIEQLERVIEYPGEMVLDTYNYANGCFCPLAVAVGLETMSEPTHEKVFDVLTGLGFKVYNTRGIAGEFYTLNRREDLLTAAREVLVEKQELARNEEKTSRVCV